MSGDFLRPCLSEWRTARALLQTFRKRRHSTWEGIRGCLCLHIWTHLASSRSGSKLNQDSQAQSQACSSSASSSQGTAKRKDLFMVQNQKIIYMESLVWASKTICSPSRPPWEERRRKSGRCFSRQGRADGGKVSETGSSCEAPAAHWAPCGKRV